MTKTKFLRPSLLFRVALLVVVTLLSFGFNIGQSTPKATAAAASTVNFQARLLNAAGAVVPDGNYNVEFKLYNSCSALAGSGGCNTFSGNVWTETRTTTNRVRVVNGYLTVNLGSVTAFSGVNWDQDLWLTMNIGGTAGSPVWDGEMTPALKLTAVPYAFQAGGLANTNGAHRSTLGWNTQTASNAIYLPDEAGVICLQSSTNCGFLTSGGASGSFVQLQGSTPGTPQTGNLNISGNAIAGSSLQSPVTYSNTLDTISGTTTLNIGTTNATSGISLNQNVSVATNKSFTALGVAVFRSATDSTSAFQVQNSGTGQVLVVDTINNFVRLVTGSITNITTASATGAVQIGADNTDNLALDDNEIMARNNGSASTLYVQKLGGGLNIQANATTIKPGSNGSSTFQVQNTSSHRIFGVDTSSAQLLLGQGSTSVGKMVFYNSSNNNSVTIQSGTTTTSYALVLPTALGASGDCIKDTTGTGILGFGACGAGGGGGGSTLQNSYDNSGTANPQILLNTTNGGIKIRDASGGVTGNLLQLQNAAGTATYFGLAATGLTLQDTAGNNAFIFDTSNSHLRVYADGTSPSAYADIYYDSNNGEAVFTASTGTTRIGSGTGNIQLQLSNSGDVLQATKTATLGAAYSSNDFTFTRNITAAGNSLTGSVVKIESTSTGSGTLASNILWVNENNNSANGNLILATKGGGSEKFKVNGDGTVTIAAGQSFNGAGALQVSAGATALTLQAPGSGLPIKVGGGDINTDTTPSLLVLDHKSSSGDPSGTNGAMYYNASSNKFRCYENGAWIDCITSMPLSAVAGADTTNSSTTASNVTGLSFSLAASTKYHFKFVILNQSAATSTGIGFGVTTPTSPTSVNWCTTTMGTLGTTSTAGNYGSYCGTGDASSFTTGMQTAATNYESVMEGYIQTGANSGTLQLRMRSETTAATTVKAGSFGILTVVQ